MEEVAKLEQASRNVQVPEEHAANTRSLLPITVSQAITAFLEHRRRAEATPEMYRQQAATLQAAVSSLLDSLAEGLAGCQPEAFAEKVKTLRELKHVTMQVCALSDTPVFAWSWVELARGPLLNPEVCEALRKEPFPEEHLSEELLRNAEALTEAEDSRVKLDAALPPTADSPATNRFFLVGCNRSPRGMETGIQRTEGESRIRGRASSGQFEEQGQRDFRSHGFQRPPQGTK